MHFGRMLAILGVVLAAVGMLLTSASSAGEAALEQLSQLPDSSFPSGFDTTWTALYNDTAAAAVIFAIAAIAALIAALLPPLGQPLKRLYGLAVATLGDADAQQRTLHRRARPRQVGRLLEALLDSALGLVAGLLGSLKVDLGGEVSQLGHDHDLVGADLHEATGDGEVLLLGTLADAQLTHPQRGQQRGVVRQHTQLASDAGAGDRVDLVRIGLAFGRDDLQQQGHG